MKGSSCPELRLEIFQLKIRSLVSEIMRKIWKHGFGSRSRTVIWIDTKLLLCTSSDKGPYMSWVWWLNVVRFRRFAFPIACPEKKRIIITRMLLLQATVKRFQFDLYVNHWRSTNVDQLMVSKISLLEQIKWIKLHKARLNHQSFMLLGHNVLMYCS